MGDVKKKGPLLSRLRFIVGALVAPHTKAVTGNAGGGHCFNDFALRLKVRSKKKQTERGDSPEEMGDFSVNKSIGANFFSGLLCAG